MAARYWVGGTASWDATAGTKWALTDGGAGGQAVPTAADDVFFTAASGAVTVSINITIADCKNLNCTGFTGTLSRTSGSLRSTGSITLSTTMTLGSSLPVQLEPVGAQTLTSAGKTFGSTFDIGSQGATGTITLQDALNLSSALTVTRGTFTTNNYAVTAASLSSSNSNTRTINLGSSTVTLNGGGVMISLQTTTNLTFNAGTSTLALSGLSAGAGVANIAGPALTFYDVTYSSTTATTLSVSTLPSSGSSLNYPSITVNNFSVSAPSSAGVTQVTFSGSWAVNGTLSTTGTAGNRRVWFRSDTYGLARTLTINSAPSLTDADFRDIYVIGTAAPISGTRIGDLRGIRGITASTPKTVYWNLAAGGNWSANAWAATSGGAVSTDNFPLAQDTAVIGVTGLNTSAVITLDSAITYFGTLDTSSRGSTSFNLTRTNAYTVYGNFVSCNGVSYGGSQGFTFSGRNTQSITSAGNFSVPLTIDSYGGTVQLADALNIGSNSLTVTNGTFNTQNYNVTAGSLSSSNTNVRTINLGSSTVTLSTGSGVGFLGANFTFNAGTSTINLAGSAGPTISGGVTFYNVSVSALPSGGSLTLTGANTFNNLTVLAPVSASLGTISVQANQTITGTLTVAGATAVRRIFLRSDTIGTQRDLTVGTLVANDCDFRDIEILGAAIGTAPTRAGDCGGNNNITFPSPKTVYWNLGGSQSWANPWAATSGGSTSINNFPLAQDTAVFDDAGSAGSVTFNAVFNVGTVDASSRTTAMTLVGTSFPPVVYGSLLLGVGVTTANISAVLSGRGTTTLLSSGVSLGGGITVDCFSGTVQLADALTLVGGMALTSGTFDAGAYNVTLATFTANSTTANTLKMGSGTWALSGTGAVWGMNSINSTLYKGAANIILTDTSAVGRTFSGVGFSYNKLTIGGTTGTSTLTITGNNQFTELASTKTVAHTIALGTTSQTFGAWTVTGTAGNVVTVTGTATITIAGARVSGVDYLAMGTTAVSAPSPREFYAGANSTGTGANVIKTAAPTPVTRYWVGGTGTWDATTTTKWSTSSGGAGGASVPTSADAVVFDMLSNATAYTVTCTATQLRCGSLTMSGPLTGNVTWAGTAPLAIHDNVTLPATGLTRSYTGAITLSGSTTGKTLTTNGVTLASAVTVNGVSCGWTLGSALTSTASLTLTNGIFNTSSFAYSGLNLSSSNSNTRTIELGSSTVTLSGFTAVDFTTSTNLTFNAGTSTLNAAGGNLQGGGKTFNNVNFTTNNGSSVDIFGQNTFNNLTVSERTSAGIKPVGIRANQTINGTLTLSAGTDATMRTFVQSDAIGTTRTLTCAAFSGTDADFRDITIAGAAAPVSGTRLGDCKGNSGITFGSGVTRYWNLAGNNNWSATGWAATSGGTPAVNNFPLAQDTAIFTSTSPGTNAIIQINASYNIGTIDMSARTSNTMSVTMGVGAATVYGNIINGAGSQFEGGAFVTFSGRNTQTISLGIAASFPGIIVNSPLGTVQLTENITVSRGIAGAVTLTNGTLDLNGKTLNISNTVDTFLTTAGTKTLAFSGGSLVLAGRGGISAFNNAASTGFSVTGTGTITLTGTTAKTFAGGGISYSGITLDQGGAGTLTITGNNTFANISNTYKATGATNITLGTTTQTVGNFTASGEAGRVLTVQGTSAASPAALVFSGAGQATQPTTDYLAITGVRAYNLTTTWYAGANSTNNGSLGWYFEVGPGGSITVYITESTTASDAASTIATLNISVSETTTASDAAAAGATLLGTLSESATAADMVEAIKLFLASVSESATSADLISAALTFASTVSELTTTSDETAVSSRVSFPTVSELIAAADSISGGLLFLSDISEATTAADTAVSLLIFNRSVAEATTASEVIAAIAAFQAAVPESVVGADVANALIQVGASINEALVSLDSAVVALTTRPEVSEAAATSESIANVYTANPLILELAQGADVAQVVASTFSATSADQANAADSIATQAVMNAYVNYLPQPMSALPLGRSAAGSVIFNDTSLVNGCEIVANGTGIGTGGFDLGGNYLGFAAGIFSGPPRADGAFIDLTDVTHIQLLIIAGDNTNGGPYYNTNFSVRVTYFNGVSFTTVGVATITPAAATNLISVTAEIPSAARVSSAYFGFSLGAKPSPYTTPVWGVKEVTLYYGGASGSEAVTNTYRAEPVIFESTAAIDATQVAASIFSATSAAQAGVSDQARVAPSNFSAVALAAAQAAESFNPAGSIYNAALPIQGAGITDSIVGAYLWNPIPDDQNPDWGVITNTQAPAWAAVSDNQAPNWQNVANTQGSGWVQINTDDAPNWQPTIEP